MQETATETTQQAYLSAHELMAGSHILHDIMIPHDVLSPDASETTFATQKIKVRPLTVAALTTITKAAQGDPGLLSLLLIKESVVEPVLQLEQIKSMHIGLVHFLADHINKLSGIAGPSSLTSDVMNEPIGRSHVLLARHYGWTPAQVSQLTPAQLEVYLFAAEKFEAGEPV